MNKAIENYQKDRSKFYVSLGLAGQVTFLLVGPVVVCLFLGFWADNFFHSTPLFIILGVIIGFAGSIFNVFKIMKMMDK